MTQNTKRNVLSLPGSATARDARKDHEEEDDDEEEEENEEDAFMWYCEKCGNKLYEEFVFVKDIVKQLPPIMERFYKNEELRTCKKCGTVMQPPVKK